VVGKLVHESLAAWRFPDAIFDRWATADARSCGLTDAGQLRDAVRRSRTLLRRYHDHSLFTEMDTAERRLHEVPYHLEREERVETGVVDALYLRDGIWTIVEFKTDRVRDDADFAALLRRKDYREQTMRYASALECLLGQRPRVILCMLNHAGRVELKTDIVGT